MDNKRGWDKDQGSIALTTELGEGLLRPHPMHIFCGDLRLQGQSSPRIAVAPQTFSGTARMSLTG
jgi:hypothetical protein